VQEVIIKGKIKRGKLNNLFDASKTSLSYHSPQFGVD
jgi:hypothetical protein